MDGTLTETEEIWTVALRRMAIALGGWLHPATRAQMLGQPLSRVVEMLHAATGYGGDAVATRHALLDQVRKALQCGVAWRPGAVELLHSVRRAGLRTALVTSSPRHLVGIVTQNLEPNAFDVTICGDDVDHPKPDAEPYLKALDLLHLDADQCVAIEDSNPGALSAERAGLPVLVVPSVEAVPATGARTIAWTLRGQSVRSLNRICAEHSARHAGTQTGRAVVA